MLFDFLRLAIQANSCHLRSEANRLVIDVSQVLCLWARGHQHKTLRFLQDSVRRGFILGKGKRKRKKKEELLDTCWYQHCWQHAYTVYQAWPELWETRVGPS